ncbi:unnamed protein product [Closterium sp. NIES-65]|nr:unnamed protein product [Closterium sp. NIES-65]
MTRILSLSMTASSRWAIVGMVRPLNSSCLVPNPQTPPPRLPHSLTMRPSMTRIMSLSMTASSRWAIVSMVRPLNLSCLVPNPQTPPSRLPYSLNMPPSMNRILSLSMTSSSRILSLSMMVSSLWVIVSMVRPLNSSALPCTQPIDSATCLLYSRTISASMTRIFTLSMMVLSRCALPIASHTSLSRRLLNGSMLTCNVPGGGGGGMNGGGRRDGGGEGGGGGSEWGMEGGERGKQGGMDGEGQEPSESLPPSHTSSSPGDF